MSVVIERGLDRNAQHVVLCPRHLESTRADGRILPRMRVWVITILVCAHGHTLCKRRIDDGYFLKQSACEFVLGYLPGEQSPRCAPRSRRKLVALGYAPVGRVPRD